jgi:hypothetical protein
MHIHSLRIGLIGCMALAVATDAWPRNEGTRRPGGTDVVVCLKNTGAVTLPVLDLARITASRVFATIDVQIKWHDGDQPSAGTSAAAIIAGQIDTHVAGESHPGALAYALPYQTAGTRIHVFIERMPPLGQGRSNGVFLGYVLAHEIGHVLQGFSSHSNAGVMKAQWDGNDIQRMLSYSLSFSEADVMMIHTGLEKSAAMSR